MCGGWGGGGGSLLSLWLSLLLTAVGRGEGRLELDKARVEEDLLQGTHGLVESQVLATGRQKQHKKSNRQEQQPPPSAISRLFILTAKPFPVRGLFPFIQGSSAAPLLIPPRQ